MRLIRFIAKLIALPVILCLWLLKWVSIFFTTMAGWIFYLIAGMFFFAGLVCLTFGLATWTDVIPLACASFLIFVMPTVCIWCVTVLENTCAGLADFIRS